jgi:glycosyltransferase involved in cell wall biosynthesis
MNPLVSVIVTCYNQGLYLEQAINSVINQSFQDYEIILVDDGSNDVRTTEIVNSLKWECVKIIKISNSGVSSARNIGIANSVGKYILILDGDDILLNNYLEKTVKVLEENPSIKVVTTGVRTFGSRKGVYQYPTYSFEKLLTQNLLVISSLFRRIDFNATSGFSTKMKEGLEDWNFWIDLLKNGGDVFHIDQELFLYRRHKISRNSAYTIDVELKLRKQIYYNHREIYDKLLINNDWILEYQEVINSKEFKLANLLLDLSKLIKFIKSKTRF